MTTAQHSTAIVLGIGQDAAGDDAVGLWVARRLAAQGIAARESNDATLLLELLASGVDVILVDAVVGAAVSGSVLRLTPDSLAKLGASPISCHGLGVAEALELARVLYGATAGRVDIVAIAVERPALAGAQLSAAAQAALEPACALVRELLTRTCRRSDQHA